MAAEPGREATPTRRRTAESPGSPPSSEHGTLPAQLAEALALRQADRDHADRVAIERSNAAEAREQALRSEVARARTEAQAQVKAEHAAETEALRRQLAEQHARSEAQASEHQRLLRDARRVAEEQGAKANEFA